MSTSWIACSSSVPAPTCVDIAAPGAGVVPLDREELVIDHDGMSSAGRTPVR